MSDTAFDVLVPIGGGTQAHEIMELATALGAGPGGRAAVLSVVEIPEERSLSEAVLLARKQRQVLRRLRRSSIDSADLALGVRAARSTDEGVREAIADGGYNLLLLGWRGTLRSEQRRPGTRQRQAIDRLALDPPCDVAVLKLRSAGASEPVKPWPPHDVLVPVRGGPHAVLALRIGEQIARAFDATLTVMHIARVGASEDQRRRDRELHDQVLARLSYERTQRIEVPADSIEDAIVEQSQHHQLVVMGATARGRRATHLFGPLPEAVAERAPCSVIVVKTALPVSPSMFGVQDTVDYRLSPQKASISTLVDRWFAQNTFHSHEFADMRELMRLKERQGVTISLALPALNEEKTIGKIITTIKRRLMEHVPLVDEMVVIDSASTDRTADIARDLGIPVFNHPDILPEHGSYAGKGEALWKSLYVTNGDIQVWIDSDITDIHPKFVYGLLGPLLTQPRVRFVKGFYRRPLNLGGSMLTTGGGRVTELTARPLINLFYPQLSGLVQPLAGEMAGRRELLERLSFFNGYGVETGLLIDILEQFGIDDIAQTDLENRIHRNQSLLSLSKMAFAIVQVVMKRLEQRQHIHLLEEINTSMKLIHYSPTELFLEVKEIEEYERPPMITIPEYIAQRAAPREPEMVAP